MPESGSKKHGNPLSGDMSDMHFRDLRRLDIGDVHFDESNSKLATFVDLVLNGEGVYKYKDKPDIRIPGYGIEHFRVSSFQRNKKLNMMRRHEATVEKKIANYDVENLTEADIFGLSLGLVSLNNLLTGTATFYGDLVFEATDGLNIEHGSVFGFAGFVNKSILSDRERCLDKVTLTKEWVQTVTLFASRVKLIERHNDRLALAITGKIVVFYE